MAAAAPAIGIDLGTTNSCVGVWQNDKVEIIANSQGSRTTPSWVAFAEDERLVGKAAVNQAAMNPKNSIHDSKRLIGRRFNDPDVQADIKHLAFDVVGQDNKPVIQVTAEGKPLELTPEQVGAMILTDMKETAEQYLGLEVADAVITVPAYFNDAQRQATKDAGEIAGLNVLRIINEPTAAAVAYGMSGEADTKAALIFDLGGGTFDVSLLSIEGGLFTVLATAGNTHLGGEDFDRNMVIHCAEDFKRKHKQDLTSNARSLRRLRSACEAAKRQLSSQTSVTIEVDALFEGIDYSTKLSRAKFEALNKDLFESCLVPVEQVLADAGKEKDEISEIILVGGSTRIPRVQELLTKFFNGKALNKSINPDEAVAYGAAVQAAIMTGATENMSKDLLLLDVTPLSLGVETNGGVMNVLIRRNTTIPCKGSGIFTTDYSNQTDLPVEVYQGERPNVEGNFKLGEFVLSGIKPAKRGEPEILVTMSIDSDGILTVGAMDKNGSKSSASMTITHNTGRLSREDIERMIGDEKKRAAQDAILKAILKQRQDLENYCYVVKDDLDDLSELHEECDALVEELTEAIQEIMDYLDTHPTDAAEIKGKRKSLEEQFTTNLVKIKKLPKKK